jgi:hypothetical protein
LSVRGKGTFTRLARAPLVALLLLLAVTAPALAAFPGSDPNESVRANTPNDPDFDRCEPDDTPAPTCSNTFGQQFERFGFAPNGSQATALYHDPTNAHVQRHMAQNTLAGRNALGQIPGVSADRAWKYSTGTASVQAAILDTGIRWSNSGLRRRVALNRGELPMPQDSSGPCAQYDCNSDGAFNVVDYAQDPRVSATTGRDDEPGADSFLDASDLIVAFSDSADDDGNGYVDDIAGWDFFDDDNNPYDASSYSSAGNHGTGRMEEAAEEGNDASGGIGVCPSCQIVPMRVWDTFVVDTNNFAQAVVYAADNDVEVVEGAVGGLFNSRFARRAFEHAYRQGVFFTIVSSDLNTADHNIPTLFDEAMQVQGTVADVHGLGQDPPNQQFIDFFQNLGIPLGTNSPISTWFRNSGTTQYGGHAHIVMPAVTGSAATGQASGAAGLVKSFARQEGIELAPNEIKQLLTGTAFDVTQADTVGLGVPDPAHPGWDQHFGYGLPDLGLALERIDQGKIPPQALITSPEWFEPLNVNQRDFVNIGARLSANRAAGYTFRVEWAPGIEPAEADFTEVNVQTRTSALDGTVATLDLQEIRGTLDSLPNGGATVDPTAPAMGPGDKDPNEPAFTVRVTATDTAGNRAEDRKVLFAYRDATLHEGWSKDLGTGGEASPRLYDLNGDNDLETVMPDSSGELHVLNADGTPLSSFNNGQPVRTRLYPNVHPGAASYSEVDPPREVLRTPGIGDIDGDLEPEIVDSAGEHVYAWEADGSTVAGFPVRIDPALSRPQDRTRNNHIKRGFAASPTLGDLNEDGDLEIVVPSLDQHLYVWDGNGNPMPGFPKKLRDPSIPGAEIITTAAIGDVSGDGKPDIVTPTQEFDDNPSAPATPGGGAAGGFSNFLTNVLANALGGSGRVYAVDRNGNFLPGWPTSPNGIVPDALPFVGPGVDHVLANVDGDPELEAIGNVASGDVMATNGSGSNAAQYDSEPQGGEHVDKSKVINLFENPIAANIDGTGGPEIIKGGVTLNQVVNLGVAVGQNLPYNHVVQAWNAQTGASLPSFPQAVEDYQLLSSPMVADVSDSPGNEVVVGTGLYYLRNFNVAGIEGTGWPKFTGGWLFATPSAGDADGDGDLEIATLTREGFGFMWDTDRPACGTNDEWWTSRHDEWNTGAYGTDTRPPGTPTDVGFNLIGAHVVTLGWKAPGDDWMCGQSQKYRILRSRTPIDHPSDGEVVGDFTDTAPAGSSQAKLITNLNSEYRFFAVLHQDEAGNWGHLASAELPYPRPNSARKVYTALVPGFNECVTPNRQHGPPLAHPSCNPPALTSTALTVQSRLAGFLRLAVVPGNEGTTEDEADVQAQVDATDVRCAGTSAACPNGQGSDYTGKLLGRVVVRITDKFNGTGGNEQGTAMDVPLEIPVSCASTASTTVGSHCDASTTMDALLPGAVPEGKRSIWGLDQATVRDAGPNGTGYGAGCPPACGDGDERTFLRQGIFVP